MRVSYTYDSTTVFCNFIVFYVDTQAPLDLLAASEHDGEIFRRVRLRSRIRGRKTICRPKVEAVLRQLILREQSGSLERLLT